MIIDSHYHMTYMGTQSIDEKVIRKRAESLYASHGTGARAAGVDVTVDEIRERLFSYLPDPHGERLLERMAKAKIDVTFLCAADNFNRGLSDEEAMSTNRTCADIAKGSHGKIFAVAAIDPRRKKAPELLTRCVQDYGMKGLKWHPENGYYPNSEEAYAVLKVAEKLGIPLLSHTGLAGALEGRRSKYCQLIHFDDVTVDFPGLKVIAAHMGGRFTWREWAARAQSRRNLYGDLAGWQLFALTKYEHFCSDLRDILDMAGSDSVLFGSDGPPFTAVAPNDHWVQIIRELPQKAPAGIKFTAKEVEGILGENARKLYGI